MRPTHSIWLSALSCSVISSWAAICFTIWENIFSACWSMSAKGWISLQLNHIRLTYTVVGFGFFMDNLPRAIIFYLIYSHLKAFLLVSGVSDGNTTWKRKESLSIPPYFSAASWTATCLKWMLKQRLCFSSWSSDWKSGKELRNSSKLRIRWNGLGKWTAPETGQRKLSITSWFTPDIKNPVENI